MNIEAVIFGFLAEGAVICACLLGIAVFLEDIRNQRIPKDVAKRLVEYKKQLKVFRD